MQALAEIIQPALQIVAILGPQTTAALVAQALILRADEVQLAVGVGGFAGRNHALAVGAADAVLHEVDPLMDAGRGAAPEAVRSGIAGRRRRITGRRRVIIAFGA